MKNVPKSLFTLANEEQENTVYLIPAAGTSAISLIPFARLLDSSRKICAFTYQGMELGTEPHTSIEEMATAYLEELFEMQPSGPYVFVGICFGGVVAYEMIRQLEAIGEKVNLLVAIDTFCPLLQGEIRSKEEEQEETLIGRDICTEAHQRASALPPENINQLLHALQTHLKAGDAYRTGLISTRIALLQSSVYPNFVHRRWDSRSTGAFQKFAISVNPHKPLIGQAAATLASAVDEILSSYLAADKH